jgi:hypothetical protein
MYALGNSSKHLPPPPRGVEISTDVTWVKNLKRGKVKVAKMEKKKSEREKKREN